MKKRWITGTRCLGLGLGALALVAAGCAGDDGNDGNDGANATNLPYFFGLSVAPPSGPAGRFVIDTSGGAGATGDGGRGGTVSVEIDSGTLGGNLLVFATGEADAGFDVPGVTTRLGDNPLEVDADLTVAVVDTEPAAGTPYLTSLDYRIRISDGDEAIRDEDPVTGLGIAAGATLTLELNYTATRVRIELDNDVVNGGTLTTALTGGGDRGGLQIQCDTYYGAAGSMIALAGPDGGDDPGANGGALAIYASVDEDDGLPTGAVVNLGPVDTSGGSGSDGGDAGSIGLYGDLVAVNTADLTARGGAGTAGVGGAGGDIGIGTMAGNLFNSGAWDASGGDGATDGGDAGDLRMGSEGGPARALNSGAWVADGGSVTDSGCEVYEDVSCAGGDGGDVGFTVAGGDAVNSGDLAARGGAGTAGAGGAGGDLEVATRPSTEGDLGGTTPAGDVRFSGDIRLSGGDGAAGGSGGRVELSLDADDSPVQQQVVLYGYTDIVTDGGAGAAAGGPAGDVLCNNLYAYSDVFDYGPSGAVVNHANVSARGGSGESGGSGGEVVLATDDYYGYTTTAEVAYNYGDLDLRGGTGTATGGGGGDLYIWGYNAAGNEGAVVTSGGDATGDMGEGDPPAAGDAGEVAVYSDLGTVSSTGMLTADGGNATGGGTTYGGDGAKVELVGASLRSAGAISATGGDGATGGNAALVFLYGLSDGTTLSAGITVDGGAGDTPGGTGQVYVDGMNVTGDYVADPVEPPPEGLPEET